MKNDPPSAPETKKQEDIQFKKDDWVTITSNLNVFRGRNGQVVEVCEGLFTSHDEYVVQLDLFGKSGSPILTTCSKWELRLNYG